MARTSGDTAARPMRHDRGGKSLVVAYLLWFFLGTFGAHRYYLGRDGSGLTMLLLTLVSLVFGFVPWATFGLVVVAIWSSIDAFLIPGMARGEG